MSWALGFSVCIKMEVGGVLPAIMVSVVTTGPLYPRERRVLRAFFMAAIRAPGSPPLFTYSLPTAMVLTCDQLFPS